MIRKVYLVSCNGGCTAMIHKNMMVLQNHMKTEENVLDAYGQAYPAYNEKQAMNIKEEELSDIEVEEDPLPITFPEIKREPEVSCMPKIYTC
jgi:hypothetical protein